MMKVAVTLLLVSLVAAAPTAPQKKASLAAKHSKSVAKKDSPVTKVVELIEELKAKITADGKNEQEIYDKYACWCEETTARKSAMIEAAKDGISRLGNMVLSKKGESNALGQEIAELEGNIAKNEKAQAKATAIREKENGEYQGDKAEMENAIGALEKAVVALSGAGTKGELLQQKDMGILQAASGVRDALHALPENHKISPDQMALLANFMKGPEDYYNDKAAAKSSYSPASTTIMGILKDMYDTFTQNLEGQTQSEATSQKNYEDMMAVKSKELADLQETTAKAKATKAEADRTLADANQEMEDTTAQMKEDTLFFDDTKSACATKADEWMERVRLRTEELAGIEKALEVLTDPEAKKLFEKAIKPGKETFFLQVEEEQEAPEQKAFKVLQKMAAKSHSIRLAALAASVRTANAGNFGKVIDAVEDMISVLKQEEQVDIDQRDWCKETTFTRETEKSRYEYKIEKTEAKIEKLNKKKEELEDSIVATDAEILATQEEVQAMEDARVAENDEFLKAKEDDEAAAELLGVAIGHLSAFYGNNDIDQGEVQGSVNLVQVKAAVHGPDDAPDATFSGKGKSSGESKGIVSILTMLKEDLEDEVKNGIKNEASAQTEFQKQRDAANNLIASLEEKKTNLNDAKSDTEEKINNAEDLQSDTEGLKGAKEEELSEMKPDCDWILENFELRAERRKAEMEGLMDAEGLLAGAGGTVFAQTGPHSFEETTFGTGLSFLQKRQ